MTTRHSRQVSLRRCLAALLAVQLMAAAVAGRWGQAVQFVSLACLILATAAGLHLLAEGLLDAAVEELKLAVERLPLEMRSPGMQILPRRPF